MIHEFVRVRKFSKHETEWGSTHFMPLVELYDPEKGFIVKDTYIIGVEILYCKTEHEKGLNQPRCLIEHVHYKI